MRTFKKYHRLANCNVLKPTDKVVQDDLSLTPRQIRQLTERGIAVSTQSLGVITDNDCPSDYLPIEHTRGTDINIAWETSQRARQNIIKSYKLNR